MRSVPCVLTRRENSDYVGLPTQLDLFDMHRQAKPVLAEMRLTGGKERDTRMVCREGRQFGISNTGSSR